MAHGSHGSFSRARARPARAARLVVLLLAVCLAGPRASAAQDLVLSTMTYVGSEGDTRDLVLSAARARIAPGGDIAYLEDVSLDAAGDGGASSLVLTCDRARLDLASSDFHAEGNVRGRTADGHRFRTEAADFDHDARTIEGDAAVEILDPAGTRLQGRGFHYDVGSQRMRMHHAVVTELSEELEP